MYNYIGDNMKKEIILLSKLGFCYGVKHSLKITLDTVENNNSIKPLHLLGRLVHNQTINDILDKKGFIIHQHKTRLEMLDDINSGTVITTAHGVGIDVLDKIKKKNLNYIDATCPNVRKVYNKIIDKINSGYAILYICNKHHPEAEAVNSFSKDIYLLDSSDTIPIIKNKPLVLFNQTTATISEIELVKNKVLDIYPNIEIIDILCQETINRQKELSYILKKNPDSYVVIIGDKKSNNTQCLYDVATKLCDNVIYILDEKEKDLNLVINSNINKVVIASGTSTPIEVINKVIDKIKTH